MRNEIGEPTGMWVRTEARAEEVIEFTAFVTAIERGDIGAGDEVRSRIVTRDRWVRVGDMRLYREIMRGDGGAAGEEDAAGEEGRGTPPLWYAS